MEVKFVLQRYNFVLILPTYFITLCPLRPYTYAILDDVNDYLLHQADNVVLTNPMIGITREIADKANEILNKEVSFY